MILKEKEKSKKKIFFFNKFLFVYFILTSFIAILFLVFVFTSWSVRTNTAKFLDYFSKAGRFEYLYLLDIGWMAFKSNFSKLERIDMEIDFENILLIENARKEAIARDTLGPTEKLPIAKAIIIYKNKKINSKIRLKGERKVHFQDKDKSSYRIELRNNNYVLGVNKFSIQKPRVRNYIHEWIFHEMMGDFGLIKLKYEFFDLYINGTKQGLYVLEEAFGKELIERNKRRNSPIFAFNDDMVNFLTKFRVNQDDPVFEIYNKKYWNRDENISIARSASQKLRDFLAGQRSLENTFDLEKFAAFFAVMDATYTYHAMGPETLKLYYNPINGLFEPIPMDGHRSHPNYHKYNQSYDDKIIIDYLDKPGFWVSKFFYKNGKLNKSFYNQYLKNLVKVSSREYINIFFEKRKKDIDKINSHIYSDYFLYDNAYNYGSGLYYFLKDDLIHRSKVIQDKTNPLKKLIQVTKNNNEFLVKIFFQHCFICLPYNTYVNLLIKNVICNMKDHEVSENKIIPVNKQVNIFSNTIINLSNNKLDNLSCSHFEFFDTIQNKSFLTKIDYLNSKFDFENINQDNPEILNKYFKKNNEKLLLKNDEIFVDSNFYIPDGYRIIVKPGQKITLTNNAFIISKSPWTIGGLGEEVVISGRKDNFGGGILITDSKETSLIKNTKFSYLTGAKENIASQFLILGTINFNQTQVKLDNVKFDKITSEDAINIFRSSFEINKAEFTENFSDAIDIDFSEGEIKHVNFKHIGNDAIDFSGSNVKIEDAFFEDIGDKLISVGENSIVKMFNIKGFNSHAGIVSKDGSIVTAAKVTLNNVQIPFAAYQKKGEYGFSIMNLKNFKLNNFYTKWITDKNSKIIADDKNVGKKIKNVLSIVDNKNLELLKL